MDDSMFWFLIVLVFCLSITITKCYGMYLASKAAAVRVDAVLQEPPVPRRRVSNKTL